MGEFQLSVGDIIKIVSFALTVGIQTGIVIAMVKKVSQSVSDIRQELKELQDSYREELKELRREVDRKVDLTKFYEDLGGWRQDIREVRKLLFEILMRGKQDEDKAA